MHDSDFYTGLPAQLYDQFFPEIDEQELAFYAKHIQISPAPALEIACGTGRILLPLLEQGFAVEGFDASPEMLQLCKRKAKQQNLRPTLYQQTMQNLKLPKKYGCLFSPLGSFGQIEDRDDAQKALRNFYDHLVLGGKLVMYLHLLWHNAPTFGDWHQHEPVMKNGTKIVVHEKLIHDPIEQLIFATYRYEVQQKNEIIAQTSHEMTMRWYSRFEFQMMLQQVGFGNIQVSAGYQDNGPFDVMLFVAQK